jgi:hypothetical protein
MTTEARGVGISAGDGLAWEGAGEKLGGDINIPEFNLNSGYIVYT